ncbi:MAG: multidrug effflux MFS transporter, partial [Actinobacteria bacterium]|nr:multidrug effflux MFS transporter [Actinomycetota bacterium]
ILGMLVVAGSVLYSETVGEKLTGNPLASLKRLGVVARDRAFLSLVLIFSLLGMAMMAFISGSSYIYQEGFGVSSRAYALFFALFAVSSAAGAQLYVWLSRKWARDRIVTWSFILTALGGLLVLLLGGRGPWAFILTYLPAPIAFSCTRPPAAHLILSQREGDSGSVAGVMSASHMAVSSVGMIIISLGLWDRVKLLGVLILSLSVLTLILWLIIGLPLSRGQARLTVAPRVSER